MMKNLYNRVKNMVSSKQASQDRVVDFIKDSKNIEDAARGSMEKRLNLIERADMRKRNA